MKINLEDLILDYDMKPVKFIENSGEPAKDIKLKDVVIRSLLMPQKNLKIDEHLKRDKLASRVHSEKEIDLVSEDIVLIKKNLPNLGFSSLVVAQVVKVLEGQDG